MSITQPMSNQMRKSDDPRLIAGMTNKYDLPIPIALAIAMDEYSKGESDFSATELLKPPQMRALNIKHKHEIVKDVTENIWAMFGTAVHLLIERATLKFNNTNRIVAGVVDPQILIPEERYFCKVTVDGIEYVISGQVDLIEGHKKILFDYKTTSVWSIIFNDDDDWLHQLNINAYLAIRNGLEIEALQIVAILRDWMKSKVGERNYPNLPIAVVPQSLWPMEKTLGLITEKIREHTAETPRPCTESERWYSGSKYAVMKGTNKRATRVFDTKNSSDPEVAANELAATSSALFVKHRPGINKRCQDYCDVADFCPQFKKLKGES